MLGLCLSPQIRGIKMATGSMPGTLSIHVWCKGSTWVVEGFRRGAGPFFFLKPPDQNSAKTKPISMQPMVEYPPSISVRLNGRIA